MSQYSEIIGSFIRNGNFPLEADYVFETEQELLDFYELPENKALLHPGLLKIVKSDENKKQALYWVVLDEDLEPTLTKLISVDNIQDIIDLEDKINKEIEDREKAITALWGTTDPSTIDSNLDSIKDLSEELKSTNQRVESIENIKDELKATVGTTSNDIIAYLQTLPYKSLTDLANKINSFLTSKNDQEGNITTFPELQDFLNGYTNKDTLSQVLSSLISQIQGTPAPTETFQTLTSAEQFVRELKQKLEDSIANLQEELNNTQEGVGLDGSGSYDADQQTTYLKGATSVMSALRTLDQVISTALDKGSVYAAKGSVKDLDALKAIDKVVAGDVYNVEEEITLNGIIYPAHNNFVYIGEQEDYADVETNWDSLGGMIEGGIDSITLSNNKLIVAIKGQSNIEVPLIGETAGLAYDGAKGKANRDALNSLPETVITSIDAPTYNTSEATLHIKKAQKNSGNNQYGESTEANTTIAAATTSTAGLMSSEDKTKLNSIESGANNYSLPTATSSILGGVKSTTTGTTAGKDYNVQVNSDGTMKVNVPWIDTTYTEATTSTAGLMSTADKTKLNNLPTGETITSDLGEITEKIGTNEYTDANYISKETNLTDAAKQLDEEIKATNDNLAILNAATIKGVQVNGTDLTPSAGKANIPNATTVADGAMSKEDKTKLDKVIDSGNGQQYLANDGAYKTLTKTTVGLGNVTNDAQVKRSEMGVANGVATLGTDGRVPSTQLPSYVDDVIDVYATYSTGSTGALSNIQLYEDSGHSTPIVGESGKIYQNIATDEPAYQFRWTGTIFAQVGATGLILGEVTGTAYDGAKGKANRDALNSAPTTVVTGFGSVTPAAANIGIAFHNTNKNSGNNQYSDGSDGTITIPSATSSVAGLMSAADKVKVDGALQTANAGVGILASYAIAAQKAAITPTDTINQAIGKLEKALNDLSQGESKPVADQIEEAITALIGGASEGYQTLKELEDAIKANETSIQELQSTKPTGWIAGVLTPTSNATQYKLYFNRNTVKDSTVSTETQTFNLDSATQSKAGVMSAADKVKVDKIITNGDGNSYLANNGQYKPISDSGNPIYKHISTTLVPQAGSPKKCLLFPINASKKSFDFYIRCQRQRVKEFVSNIHVVMGCSPTGMDLHTYSTPQIICDSDILQGAYYVENPGNPSDRYLAIQADYFGVLNDTAIIDLYSCVDFIDDADNTLSLLTESTIGFTVTLEEIEDVILKNNGYTKIAKVASDQNLLNTNGGYTAVSAIGEALNLDQYLTSIPKASASTLGGVKIGAGLSITGDGVLSATGGGTADSVEWGNVVGKPSAFATNIANISDLNSSWDSILRAAPGAYVTRWPSWNEITSKPAQFTPASHTHTASQITDLTSTLGNYATNASVQQAISEATYNTGHNTATSLTSVPITKRLVIANLSAGGTLSLAGTPADGRELHIIVKSTNGGAVTLPTSGSWIVMGEKSLTLEAGGYCEINIISDGSNLYARMG